MKITIPYTPRHPGVHEMFEGHRFSVLVAHRRFGKTVLAVNHLLKMALLSDRPAGRYAYVGPFRNQAKKNTWSYFKHYSGPVPGRQLNESELRLDLPNGSCIHVLGADNPDSLRGTYFDGVVLDEVAQMKAEVWGEIIQPALADRKGWAVFIGTPKGINLFSEIYFSAVKRQEEPGSGWAAMSVPVTESAALDAAEVARLRAELSDNAFRQELLCDFSAASDDVLITLDEARAAMGRRVDETLRKEWPVVVGVDVARFGGDATVFMTRQGLSAREPVVLRGRSNTEVAGRLLDYLAETGAEHVNIDQGQGTGVIDIVADALRGRACSVNEVPFGSRALDDGKFVNRRCEMWALMRDWLRAGGSIPESQALLADLTGPRYSFDAQGRLKLEAKEEIRKRLGRSTDLGDALALTFAVRLSPKLASDWRREEQRRRQRLREINPFL